MEPRPPDGADAPKRLRVVIGVDYTDAGELALERAFEIILQEPHGELHLVHALRPTEPPSRGLLVLDAHTVKQARERLRAHGERALDTFLLRHPERIGVPLRTSYHVRIAEPARELIRVVEKVDANLIVVGTHGRRGLARAALGSVAEELVRLSPCAVLVVRENPVEAVDVRDPVPAGQSLESR